MSVHCGPLSPTFISKNFHQNRMLLGILELCAHYVLYMGFVYHSE